MVKGLLAQLKRKLSIGQSSANIPPPDTQIPTNKMARDLSQKPAMVDSPATSVATPAQHRGSSLQVDSLEPTQELLKLTDDVLDAMEAEGFDPYNTKNPTNSTSWDRTTTRKR